MLAVPPTWDKTILELNYGHGGAFKVGINQPAQYNHFAYLPKVHTFNGFYKTPWEHTAKRYGRVVQPALMLVDNKIYTSFYCTTSNSIAELS